MYCGHCGAAVEEHDQFCRSCGARFVDVGVPPAGAGTLPGSLPPPGASTAVAGAWTGGDPTMALPVAPDDVDPTSLIAVTSGPEGGPGARPFLIAAAFALIVAAGIVAFFVLRGNGSTARPIPSGPTDATASTVAPTTGVLPSVETTAVPTVPTTGPPTTAVATAPPSATVAPTAPPTTAAPGGTVPINTATIPGAPPSSVPAVVPSVVATTARPRPVTTTTRPRATTTTTTTTVATTTPAPTPAPTATPGPVAVSAVRASAARADGIDSCGQPTSYEANNVLDGQLATAWMTQGDGAGQFLEFDIAPGAQLTHVGLVPGYAKQDPCSGSDRFHDMRRIVQVRWSFDGGASVTQSLDPDSATMQTLQLAAPVNATTVRLTILGTTDPGTAGFDYSPISEVTLT